MTVVMIAEEGARWQRRLDEIGCALGYDARLGRLAIAWRRAHDAPTTIEVLEDEGGGAVCVTSAQRAGEVKALTFLDEALIASGFGGGLIIEAQAAAREEAALAADAACALPDGSLLLSRGPIKRWAVGAALRAFEDRGVFSAEALSASPDGRWAASTAHEAHVRLWDVEACAQVKRITIKGYQRSPVVAFSPDGAALAYGGVPTPMRMEQVALLNVDKKWSPRGLLPTGSHLFVHGLGFSQGGDRLWCLQHDIKKTGWRVMVWEWPSTTLRAIITGGADAYIVGAAMRADGRRIYVLRSDALLYAFDLP